MYTQWGIRMLEWRGRQVVVDHMRNADREMIECGISTADIIEMLEHGVSPVKRGKGIIERWIRDGMSIMIVVIEDYGDYWLVRHVSRVRCTKRLMRIMRGVE